MSARMKFERGVLERIIDRRGHDRCLLQLADRVLRHGRRLDLAANSFRRNPSRLVVQPLYLNSRP